MSYLCNAKPFTAGLLLFFIILSITHTSAKVEISNALEVNIVFCTQDKRVIDQIYLQLNGMKYVQETYFGGSFSNMAPFLLQMLREPLQRVTIWLPVGLFIFVSIEMPALN